LPARRQLQPGPTPLRHYLQRLGAFLAPASVEAADNALRQFFERIIEWDWPEAPARNPVIAGDIPNKPEPLPKFLDDRDAAKLMARRPGGARPGGVRPVPRRGRPA